MNLIAVLRIALAALKLNKLRSGLTMLGIIIGVAAVITMVGVGKGAQARIEERIKSLGSNVMVVMASSVQTRGLRLGAGSGQSISEDDGYFLEREIPEIQAAPSLRGGAQVVAGNQNWSTQLHGITPNYFPVRNWTVTSGRVFEQSDMDGAPKLALIGQTAASQLFGDGDPVGQVIRVNRVPFTVIGLLERKGQSLIGQDQDDVVLMPISTARARITGQAQRSKLRSVTAIWVKVADGYNMREAEDKVRQALRTRHRLDAEQGDDFTLRNLSEILQAQEMASRALAALLAAIASVSLLVGGIGIMNIMLVSVTERTREIGLRLAVGARARDILSQFLVEAVTLSLIGGLIGVVLGVIASMLVGEIADWRVELTLDAIVMAFAFAGAVGIFFGYYPARKAARMSPIDALRYE